MLTFLRIEKPVVKENIFLLLSVGIIWTVFTGILAFLLVTREDSTRVGKFSVDGKFNL